MERYRVALFIHLHDALDTQQARAVALGQTVQPFAERGQWLGLVPLQGERLDRVVMRRAQ